MTPPTGNSDHLSGSVRPRFGALLILAGAVALSILRCGPPTPEFTAAEMSVVRRVEGDAQAPIADASLLTVAVAAISRSSGSSPEHLRLPSIVAGVCLVATAFALAALLSGPAAGCVAAMLAAAHPLLVDTSRHLECGVWLALGFGLLHLSLSLSTRRGLQIGAVTLSTVVLVLAGYPGIFAVLVMALLLPFGDRAATKLGALILGATLATIIWWSSGAPLPPGAYFSEPLPLALRRAAALMSAGVNDLTAAAVVLPAAATVGLLMGRGRHGVLGLALSALGMVIGILAAQAARSVTFDGEPLAPAAFALCVLAGVGVDWTLARLDQRRWQLVWGSVLAFAIVLLWGWGGWGRTNESVPTWSGAARIVEKNAVADDEIVVLLDRPALTFHVPALEQRIVPQVSVLRSVLYYTGQKHYWFVSPSNVQFYPEWRKARDLMARLSILDVSPSDSILVWYVGQNGMDELQIQVAFFDLPTASLVRRTLLLDLFMAIGPLPQLLWKVDQIALCDEPLNFRNPSLLALVSYLAEHGHPDRAASLAFRLATAVPDWAEAQSVLAAFRPARPSI